MTLLGELPGGAGAVPVAEVVEQDHARAWSREAAHHVLDRPDVGGVDAGQPLEVRQGPLEAGPGGQRAGRQHDRFRVVAGDIVGLDQRVEPDLDREPRELALVPLDEIEDLGAARLQTRKAKAAAEHRCRLGKRNAVAALGRDPRRLQPCGTAADDQDGARARARRAAVAPRNSRPAEGLTRQEIQ